jgi:hypothetical protein
MGVGARCAHDSRRDAGATRSTASFEPRDAVEARLAMQMVTVHNPSVENGLLGLVWLLKNGNLPGDPSTAPRCGARTRRGTPCCAPAMRGRQRCRMHGGASTGPRTKRGLARSRRANWKHGRYSAAEKLEVRQVCELVRECRAQIRDMKRQA